MNVTGVTVATEWFESWFESEHYLNLYSHRDKNDALQMISFLKEKLSLKPGARILDLGCGPGRHSLIFAKEAFKVTGFDLSKRLLEAACKGISLEGIDLSLVRGDIRHLPFRRGFDLVMSVFTSWGYFDDDQENFEVLRQALSLKKQTGYFILDLLNQGFLVENLIPSDTISRNGITYQIKREITGNRVIKTIDFMENGEMKSFQESVRLYEAGDIIEVLEEAGASKISLYGDYKGGKFDRLSSPRLICIAN